MASDRLSRFADALLEEADEKKKQVEKELNDKKQHQLDQIDKNLNEYFNSSVNTGKYKLDHQKQIYLTRRETELRRILLQNRQKNFNYIFDEAKRNIEQFTQTPAYHEKLKRDFAEASVLFTKCEGAVVCKVMEKDIELAKKFFNLPKISIVKSERDIIGGFTLENAELKLFADCTLSARLEEEKTKFCKTSGLIVD